MIAELILATLFSAQEPKIITCEVVTVDQSVACPTPRGMELFIFTDKADAKELFDLWRLRAPMQAGRANADAPLYSGEVRVGDKVKAIIDSEKFAVTECNVRVWERVKAWQLFRQGEIPPNPLYTLPDDCQPTYGKN